VAKIESSSLAKKNKETGRIQSESNIYDTGGGSGVSARADVRIRGRDGEIVPKNKKEEGRTES